jgi:hypothetical protein
MRLKGLKSFEARRCNRGAGSKLSFTAVREQISLPIYQAMKS